MNFRELGVHSVVMDGEIAFNTVVLYVTGTRAIYTEKNLICDEFFVLPATEVSYSSIGIYKRFKVHNWFVDCFNDADKVFKNKKWWKTSVREIFMNELLKCKNHVSNSRISETIMGVNGGIYDFNCTPELLPTNKFKLDNRYVYITDYREARLLMTNGGLGSDATIMTMAVQTADNMDSFLVDVQKHGALKNVVRKNLGRAAKEVSVLGKDMTYIAEPYIRFLERVVVPVMTNHKSKMTQEDKDAFTAIFHSSKHITP